MELKTILQDGKKLKWIVGIGIVGILLIFVSSLWPKGEKTPAPDDAPDTAQTPTNEQYEQRYQEMVAQLVRGIEGVGRASVVVTLESGVEYVYETEENKTADTQNNESTTYSQKNSLQRKTLLVEDDNGRKKPLLKTTLEPKVRGVVVVCEGGGDVRVVERVTTAVTTALGVSSARVAVLEAAGS